MKPGMPPLQSVRVLDKVRERVRYLHYSLKTEKPTCTGSASTSAGALPKEGDSHLAA